MKDTETTMPDMAVGMETRRIEVNGVSVTYHEAGQANTDTAPIVLIHGSSGSTLGHFGFTWGPLWGHFGVALGSHWGHFGSFLGSLLGRCGSLWGQIRV